MKVECSLRRQATAFMDEVKIHTQSPSLLVIRKTIIATSETVYLNGFRLL